MASGIAHCLLSTPRRESPNDQVEGRLKVDRPGQALTRPFI